MLENSSKADDALQAGQTVLDRSNVEQYVDLGSSFSKMSEWSNDPTDMKLDLYFSKNPNAPGLPEEYNIPTLRPIIVLPDLDSGHTFLLTDDNERYYIWNEFEAEMWHFKDKGGQLKRDDVVYKVQADDYGRNEIERQFRMDRGSD